jgi:hypothetical protein
MANSNSVLCDHPCPLHDKCARYSEGLDRKNTNHIDPMPYGLNRADKCGHFEPIDHDFIIAKVVNFLKPKWQ